ncbi:Protein rolling stone [Lucilia cuprina]|uniref:Protein rolling stone n=1 Tax=Lucilia cuprina TaxID=7375 RepID=A0A0L0CQ92_LUCCU|nr:Protein rolling stone [Lucilia cuprina]KNC33609.1 Protein rolling stone [Lucilia cuprina]
MQLTGNCCDNLCSEFKLKNFGFDHDHQDQFYRSQWQSGERSWLFLCYRWIWALFFIAVFLACVILQFCEGKYFIFLTNWGIILCSLTQLLAAILVTRWHFDLASVRSDHCERNGRTKKSPLLIKLYWLLHDVALPLSLVITTIYWTFLHGKMNKPSRFPVISFVTHCLNSVFMLVDFFIVAFPVRLLHTLYAMLLPIIFCFFTLIYFFCGGTDEYGNHYVYPLLDWTIPVRCVVTFVGVFGLYCIYSILLFVVYKLRRFLHRSLSVVWSPHCVGLI